MNIAFENLPYILLGILVLLIIISILFIKPKIPKIRIHGKTDEGKWWDVLLPKSLPGEITSRFILGLIEWLLFVFTVKFIAPDFWKIWWGDLPLFILSNVVVLIVLTVTFRSTRAIRWFATILVLLVVAILGNSYLEKLEDKGLVSLSSSSSAKVEKHKHSKKRVRTAPNWDSYDVRIITIPPRGGVVYLESRGFQYDCLSSGKVSTYLQTLPCGPYVDHSTIKGRPSWIRFVPDGGQPMKVAFGYRYNRN